MILGIGVDICEIGRIEDSIARHGDSFAARLLHPNEMEIYKAHKQKAKYLAKRFAAKEAFAKALGSGIAQGVSWQDIEIINNSQGKPDLVLHGSTQLRAHEKGCGNLFVSISDERHYAVAQVVIESVSPSDK